MKTIESVGCTKHGDESWKIAFDNVLTVNLCIQQFNTYQVWIPEFGDKTHSFFFYSESLDEAKSVAIKYVRKTILTKIDRLYDVLEKIENNHASRSLKPLRYKTGDHVVFCDENDVFQAVILESFLEQDENDSMAWVDYMITWGPGANDFCGVNERDLNAFIPNREIRESLDNLYRDYLEK